MEYMSLMGSEQVQSAGRQIADAAEQIQRAASHFEFCVDRLIRALDEHAQRIEDVTKDTP